MTEIKLTLDDPTVSARALRYVVEEYLAKKHAEGMVGSGSMAPLLDQIADSIEEQVKPAIEEPKEFGSIVRAGYDAHTDRVLWVRTPGGWYAEESAGFHAYFPGLHNPEVLRVGIGETEDDPAVDQAYGNGQYVGWGEALAAASRKLRTLRAEAITSERKNAYDVAIRTVEEMQP